MGCDFNPSIFLYDRVSLYRDNKCEGTLDNDGVGP